jgi:uncharacterized protein YndB with AHSA1/START domain
MNTITIQTEISSSIEKVWAAWSNPDAVKEWNQASDDWYCPSAENDLKVGGKFNYLMSSKDNSSKFNFTGVYTEVIPFEKIAYTMDDGRKVETKFVAKGNLVEVVETFEMENENSEEKQREGWQAVLYNFKYYVERN